MLKFDFRGYQDKLTFLRYQAVFYQHSLFKNTEALDYLLTNRNLTISTIKAFKLGYSPSFEKLMLFLNMNNLETDNLISTGSCIDKTNNLYYLFDNRIIFPLFNLEKQVVGFSGRKWNETANNHIAKYVNSSSSSVFSKSLLLYNYWNLFSNSLNYVILVEGIIDVITLFQNGIHNVVAPCGTSFTVEQAYLLKYFTDNVILLYDSDDAGKKASQKVLNLCKSVNLNPVLLTLDGAKDPDEFINNYGILDFQKSLSSYAKKYFK